MIRSVFGLTSMIVNELSDRQKNRDHVNPISFTLKPKTSVCECKRERLTERLSKLLEDPGGEQRFRKFSEEQFESSSYHVDVLPLAVVQVQWLL